MRGFCLDANGDVVIESERIKMISGKDLLRQTVQKVIGTNKGEWFLNENEGIDFRVVLTKAPDLEAVRNEIASALIQIDESFIIQDFSMETVGRVLKIHFLAVNDDESEIGGEAEYGT